MPKALIASLVLACSATSAAAQSETRCGWIDNPTPANWWMADADGEWLISLQGRGWRSEIFDIEWSGTSEWVETNVHYGYGCGCIAGTFNRQTRWLTTAESAEWLPLKRCTSDPALPPRS